MKVIGVINQKGGVAKTTTTLNLGAYLSNFNKKTLIIDLDPQGNATSGLGIQRGDLEYCIYDALINGIDIDIVKKKTDHENLDIIPASIQLAGAEVEMVSMMSREYILKNLLKKVGIYDYVLIDCPPSLGLLTVNALTAANEYLVPIQCEYFALEGLGQLLKTVKVIKSNLNEDLKMAGALLTMHNSTTNLSSEVVSEVKAFFGKEVYETLIPRNVRLSEAPSHGQTIDKYDPSSKGAKAYESLAKEVIDRG